MWMCTRMSVCSIRCVSTVVSSHLLGEFGWMCVCACDETVIHNKLICYNTVSVLLTVASVQKDWIPIVIFSRINSDFSSQNVIRANCLIILFCFFSLFPSFQMAVYRNEQLFFFSLSTAKKLRNATQSHLNKERSICKWNLFHKSENSNAIERTSRRKSYNKRIPHRKSLHLNCFFSYNSSQFCSCYCYSTNSVFVCKEKGKHHRINDLHVEKNKQTNQQFNTRD